MITTVDVCLISFYIHFYAIVYILIKTMGHQVIDLPLWPVYGVSLPATELMGAPSLDLWWTPGTFSTVVVKSGYTP